jgi:hypothetical protein
MDSHERPGGPVRSLPLRQPWQVIVVSGLITTAVAVALNYLIARELTLGFAVGVASILGGFMTNSGWFRRHVLGRLRSTSRWGAGKPGERWK